ncbi:MAG: preprotein translocase subunit SecE [Candidatus Lumbricidophila eiseniae]|uniref:Protein translocase subunit SecE n=1 Tax=Candidatus Lumbricidiphila eiseniae TaxID=1969409 RepID=A0A2A6FMU8_9MICO|nr:MAG: preprotein translocase subunit SecE [Candidatus Lumbricidophila eiseniae]
MARNEHDEPSEDLVETARREKSERRNPFARIVLFLRQVVGELRKVVTPTRQELLRYTGVVLVFVLIMMGIVWVLDKGFGWAIIYVFGTPE